MLVFWCAGVAWQYQTPIRFPAVKRGLILEWEADRSLSEWSWCRKAIGGIYFTRKWPAETLQPVLKFDNIKLRLDSGIFKYICWLNGSVFGGDDRGFLKESRPIYWHQCRLVTSQLFFCLHIYSLWLFLRSLKLLNTFFSCFCQEVPIKSRKNEVFKKLHLFSETFVLE